MKKLVFIIFYLVSLSIISCKQIKDTAHKKDVSKNNIEKLIKELNNPTSSTVLVIAHRADWRNFPENSLEAISSSIEMGVDMVELDIAKTKDNQLILMHDRTLDRTTTGEGFVTDYTLDAIKSLFLKNGAGVPTKYKIPTLEEALLACKGKVLVNLDKSYELFHEVFELAKKTGTTNQIVVKGNDKTVEQIISDFGNKLDSVIFMPIINLDTQPNAQNIIDDYQKKLPIKAFEIIFSKDTSKVIHRFSEIKNKGSRVWVNSLWSSLNAGYEDDAALKNTDSIYGWYVKKGVTMIQTDRPELLLTYLKSKGLHD